MDSTTNWKDWMDIMDKITEKSIYNFIQPDMTMPYSNKMNLIRNIVIMLTFIGVVITRRMIIFIYGAVMVVLITILRILNSKKTIDGFRNDENSEEEEEEKENEVEGFANNETPHNPKSLEEVIVQTYNPITSSNPYGNVLVNHILDDPHRKPAPPAVNSKVHEEIVTATKEMIQKNNPGIDVQKDLIGDDAQKYTLDRSSLVFHTMPSTQIPNNQGAYAQFLYGDTGKCKDQNCNSSMTE
jgi:hypothetical protein